MNTIALLRNLYNNSIARRSKFVVLVAFILFYVAYTKYNEKKRTHKQLSRQASRTGVFTDEPLIAFGGGGLLGFYYIGIMAYLHDNFDLSNARFSGLSIGSTAAAGLAHELPTEAVIIFAMKWFKLQADRPLKCLLIKPSEFCRIGMSISKQFGITDEWIKSKSDRLYIGVTNISTFPFKHEIMNGTDVQTRYDSFYTMSCSCRIVPFFTVPGYLKDNYVLDGGLSATYTIPKDANPDKVIRVSVSSRIFADIQPDATSDACFTWLDAVTTPGLDKMGEQFKRGYLDALRCRSKLIAKGLKVKSSIPGGINKLDSHVNAVNMYGTQIFAGEFEEQDLSYLMDN